MAARPSTYILRKAWLLGKKMARKERRLRPNLRDVARHCSYSFFRQVHRHSMERTAAFQYWERQIQMLIEREGNGRGVRMNDPRVWGEFYTCYGEPIRNVFWAAWEDALMLQAMYEREATRITHARSDLPAPLHVANAAGSVTEEPDSWDHLAQKIFDELGEDAGAQGAQGLS